MRRALLSITPVVLLVTSAASADTGNKHFIVTCALFKVQANAGANGDRAPHTLNLLVDGMPSDNNFMSVLDTFDPDRVAKTGPFKKAFFDGTKFAALTGDTKLPTTRLLALTSRGSAEYDATLGDVGKREGFLAGRCWMSNVTGADEEFEKLKVEEISQ